MTEKQVILRLKLLKEIKPSQEWAFLVKNQIFSSPSITVVSVPFYKKVLSGILDVFYAHQKLAYSFAVFMFLFSGMFGLAQYTLPGDPLFTVKKITEQSQAALSGESIASTSAKSLKNRSNDLAQVVKQQKSNNITSAKREINEATKNLVNAIQKDKDPEAVKEIALEIKGNETLLSFFEDSDLKEASQMLYKAIDEQMILDLENTMLSQEQEEILAEAKLIFSEGKYSLALEKILLISN